MITSTVLLLASLCTADKCDVYALDSFTRPSVELVDAFEDCTKESLKRELSKVGKGVTFIQDCYLVTDNQEDYYTAESPSGDFVTVFKDK